MVSALVRALSRPLEPSRPPQPADAVVVLGAPLGPLLDERVRAGVRLWREGLAPLICLTGYGEASDMARHAASLGVPGSAIVVEPSARNTAENARRTAALLLPARPRVWVVTQPFHLRRAAFWFRVAGFDPLPFRIPDSVQYARADHGLGLVLGEYGAWLHAGAFEIGLRLGVLRR